MTVNKLQLPAKENAVQLKINEIIDNLGGGGANTDLSNLTATGEAHFLKNTATGSSSLTIGGIASDKNYSVNIGANSGFNNSGSYNIAIGYYSEVSGANHSIAIGSDYRTLATADYASVIGSQAVVTCNYGTAIGAQATVDGLGNEAGIALGYGATCYVEGIQIGYGTNSTSKSLCVGFYDSNNPANYQLLDGTTGLIPDDRISSNIARTSQIPSTSGFEQTTNKVTSISSSSTDTQYPSAKSVIELLKIIYPVGSVYLSTNSTCPLADLFGTWTLVASGKALWTGTGSNGGTTIAESLPDFEGTGNCKTSTNGSTSGWSGALSYSVTSSNTTPTGSGKDTNGTITFKASKGSTKYSGTKVQPAAYVVNVWKRTA